MMTRKIFQTFTACGFLFAAFLVFSIQIEAQSKNDQKRAQQLVVLGDKAFRQKNYRVALDHYSQAVALVPVNPSAHFWKGLTHYYLNESEPALSEFDLALQQGHKKPLDVYQIRWRLNFVKKDYDAALEDIKRGAALDPNNGDFLAARADIMLAKGDNKEAFEAYQKAVLKSPNNAELYYNLAKVNYNLGDNERQAAAAEDAIQKRTQNLADAYRLLADARQKQRRFPEAIDAYKKTLSSNPQNYEAYRNLAEIYRSENRIDEAIDISKRGLVQFANDGHIYTDLS
ncbi:MAG: tetratricopeptide repeat protein, partial [Pyrinomonadaceae bacterium]